MGAGRLVPVDLAHALLHRLETVSEGFPLGLFLHQDLFSRCNAHRSEEVETLRSGAQGGLVFVVHHRLQHLGIGLIALGQHVDLVVAGLLELRADACLLVADFLERSGDLADGLVIVEQVFHLQSGLLHLGHHLDQTEIVMLAHEEGDELVERVVFLLSFLVEFQGACLLYCGQHLALVIHAEGNGLEPHHAPEVALQGL